MMGAWCAYHQRWTPVAVRSAYPVCIAGAGLCIFGYVRYDNPSLAIALVLVVLFIAIIVWGEWMGVPAGIYESEEGLKCRWLYGSYVVPWTEIVGFNHRKSGTKDRVYAHKTNGRYRLLAGVLQGQRVVWDGGETRDIVAVLNERLATWRQMSALEANQEHASPRS